MHKKIGIWKYDANFNCPKCPGETKDLSFTFCAGGVTKEGEICCGIRAGYEHLHIVCEVCGHRTLMQTCDYDDRKEGKQDENYVCVVIDEEEETPAATFEG